MAEAPRRELGPKLSFVVSCVVLIVEMYTNSAQKQRQERAGRGTRVYSLLISFPPLFFCLFCKDCTGNRMGESVIWNCMVVENCTT